MGASTHRRTERAGRLANPSTPLGALARALLGARWPSDSCAGCRRRAMSALAAPGPWAWDTPEMCVYGPNPAHKQEWTNAGPPAPRSDKSPCPRDITAIECEELLRSAVPEEADDLRSRRYAARRTDDGVELFAAQAHSPAGQEPIEFHGYPVSTAPAKVLRSLRDRGDLLAPEYRRLVKGLR